MIKNFIIFILCITSFSAYASTFSPCFWSYLDDPDVKHLCYAIEMKRIGQCTFINDESLKNYCIAVIDFNKKYCEKIKDNFVYQQCISYVENGSKEKYPLLPLHFNIK